MAEKKASANCVNIRVLINKKTQRILYAEAGKEFVDLLFSFLLLPTGTVVKFLSESEVSDSVGCITNLYDSVEKLSSTYMTGNKSDLLQPRIAAGSASEILPVRYSTPVASYYVCSNHGGGYCSSCRPRYGQQIQHSVSLRSGQPCNCGQPMQTEVKLAIPPSTKTSEGYVKKTFTFVITDDLIITPTSTIACIALLNKLRVRDLTDLEERNLSVGFDEALSLLRASLISTSALNDVFGDRLRLASMIKQLVTAPGQGFKGSLSNV